MTLITVLADSALCYSLAPEPDDGQGYGIWDAPAHLAIGTRNLVDRPPVVGSNLKLTAPA